MGGGNDKDTTEIIVWFLGVSAFCAIGALVLIICWRKFSGQDDSENDAGAINLEFLLDPNAPTDPNTNLFSSPMHLNQNLEDEDVRKPKKKKIKLGRLHHLDEEDDDDDDDNADDQGNNDDDDDDENEEALMEDYEPPNFNRI